MTATVRRPCPACATEEMQVAAVGSVEIDVCPKCLGAWFDGGELTAVVKGPRVGQLLAAARAGEPRCWSCHAPVSGDACAACRAGQLACPECGRNGLIGVEEAGVQLDVCVPCGGFWFDHGELEAIAGEQAPKMQELLGKRRGAASGVPDNRVDCSSCDRQLRRAHAFCEGDDIFCGSCAPAGSSQLVVDLSSLRREESYNDVLEAFDDRADYGYRHAPIGMFLRWLLRS